MKIIECKSFIVENYTVFAVKISFYRRDLSVLFEKEFSQMQKEKRCSKKVEAEKENPGPVINLEKSSHHSE